MAFEVFTKLIVYVYHFSFLFVEANLNTSSQLSFPPWAALHIDVTGRQILPAILSCHRWQIYSVAIGMREVWHKPLSINSYSFSCPHWIPKVATHNHSANGKQEMRGGGSPKQILIGQWGRKGYCMWPMELGSRQFSALAETELKKSIVMVYKFTAH